MSNILMQAGWCFTASLFLPVLAWMAMPLLPRSAALRHLVWVAVFAVLLLLPALVLVVPSQIVLHPAAAPASVAMVSAPVRGWSMADAVALLPLAWLAGVLWNLARLALGLSGIYRLRRTSVPFDGSQDVRLADDGPLAFGLLRPLILLPHEADNWPLARLVAVLAHERAHLARHDSLTQMLAQITCALYWANPLLWLAARAMRHQAEVAADNAVLAGGVRPSDYAAELLQLAGERRLIGAVAMAAPSLEARVKSVLSPTPLRTGVSIVDGLKIAWLGSAAVVALALVRPAIAEVQDAPVVQSAPLPAPAASPAAAAAPAPLAASAPPVQAAPVADVAPPVPMPGHHHHHHVSAEGLTPEEKAQLDAATAQVDASMARLGPEIDRAISQARNSEAKAKAAQEAAQSIQRAMPQVHAAIAQAIAQIRPVIYHAISDVRIETKVSATLDRVQVKIDADLARAEQDAEHASARARLHAGADMPPDPPEPPEPAQPSNP